LCEFELLVPVQDKYVLNILTEVLLIQESERLFRLSTTLLANTEIALGLGIGVV